MANEYLKRTPTSGGNRTTWTLSCWAKISGVTAAILTPFGAYRTGTSQGDDIFFRTGTGGAVRFTSINSSTGSGYVGDIVDNAYKRDNASWIHVMAVANTTAGGTTDRWHLYINGIRITDTSNNTYPTDNYETNINNLVQHYIGAAGGGDEGQISDAFFVDGQALTPDVFGFYKEGKGYVSAGSTIATDFRPGQWVPKAPRTIKSEINRKGGFGVNGFYLPMNDSSNFGADFHTTPNSIITLKGENLPQPRNGAPETTDAYVSQLREDPYASNLVLAVPGISGGQGSGYGDYSADIKGSGSNKTIIPGNVSIGFTGSYYGSALTGFSTDPATFIQNHEDFRYGSDDFTVEGWIYVTDDTTGTSSIISLWNTTNNRRSWAIFKDSNSASGGIRFVTSDDGTYNAQYNLDPNVSLSLDQWNHFAVEKEGNTGRVYQNGVCVGIDTNFPTTLYSNNDDNLLVGAGIATYMGSNGEQFTNGYIQDLRVYKGVAKYKSGFDVSKPYTPVGIGTWRAVPDTTANNFATWNPLWDSMNTTNNASFSDGNLKVTGTNSDPLQGTGTVGVTTGKWYYETRITANPYSGAILLGIRPAEYFTSNAQNRTSYRSNGSVFNDAGSTVQSGTTYATNDIIGVAFDMNTKNLWFSKNGSWVYSGDPDAGTDAAVSFASTYTNYTPFFAFDNGAGTEIIDTNFGQNPTFSGNVSAASTQRNADSNGKGEFRYEPPSGFLALCADNLPTPAIADPGEHFKTVLYIGDDSGGNSRNNIRVGFKPDLVWLKNRTSSGDHGIWDSVRGATYKLISNNTDGESISNGVLSFDADGFSKQGFSVAGSNYVAWCWKAGGPAVTNTDGALTSQVSVNQSAGFSIVTYTTPGTATNFGHGLGKKPAFALFKARNDSGNWAVYHQSLGTNTIRLSTTGAADTSADAFNNTAPTDTLMYLGTWAGTNNPNINWVSYLWSEIEGFSKFGTYVGNANADGPFVYCGFKPAWIMVKVTTATNSWVIYDSSRSSTNIVNNRLRADLSNAEDTHNGVDFLSNGFKLRDAGSSSTNASQTYIFAAFAESPFQTANAK